MKINKSILDRFKEYKRINNQISKKVISAENNCLIHSENKDFLYSFNNNLFIIKKIGAKSSDGSIYLSSIITKSKSYYFITKIQLFLDFKELILLNKVTKYAIEYKNIHLPLVYNYLKCDKFNKFDLLLPNNININKKQNNYNYKYIESTSYYSIFAELADGDTKKFIEKPSITSKDLYNAISQCFMAIISVHNAGIYHRDAHLGNFLYHTVIAGNCIKYKYRDLIFYIENRGYNWVIWDFGRSKELSSKYIYLLYEDLLLFIESLIKSDELNIINSNKIILQKILNIIEKHKYIYTIIKKLLNDDILFSKVPIGKVLTTIILE